MGMLDYNLRIRQDELQALKKLLLSYSLYELEKKFSEKEINDLKDILNKVEKLLI